VARTSRNADQQALPSQHREQQLQRCALDSDNRGMAKQHESVIAAQKSASAPFEPGSMVVVTLGNPRDKFWGMILSLAAEGLSMSGLELASFEDFVLMVKEGESFSPAVVFFPMHRIERIELDLPDGSLPSLSQRFSAKTGLDPAELLSSTGASGPRSLAGNKGPA
jgi:hypothetical protein